MLLFRYKGEIWDGGTYGELDQLESAHCGMTFVFDRTPGFKYLMHYNELAETGELERAVVETAVGASRASTEERAVWETAKPSITD